MCSINSIIWLYSMQRHMSSSIMFSQTVVSLSNQKLLGLKLVSSNLSFNIIHPEPICTRINRLIRSESNDDMYGMILRMSMGVTTKGKKSLLHKKSRIPGFWLISQHFRSFAIIQRVPTMRKMEKVAKNRMWMHQNVIWFVNRRMFWLY